MLILGGESKSDGGNSNNGENILGSWKGMYSYSSNTDYEIWTFCNNGSY